MARYTLRPDTPAWVAQSWGFFGAACLFESLAILWLDHPLGIRWLLLLVLVLTVYVCFALSKTIRDNRDGQVDTVPWILMTWLISGAAVVGLLAGINYVAGDWRTRMILLGGLGWCVESSLVLAKTIRDNNDARKPPADPAPVGPPSLDVWAVNEGTLTGAEQAGNR